MNFARTARITTALLFVSVFLTACGFKPMHAPASFGGTGVSYTDITVVTVKEERPDFLLKQALRDRIGDHNKTRYLLSIEPKIRRRALGIGDDDVASRYDLTMEAKFELIDARSGDVVYKDKVRAISTFGSPRDPYGTITAQDNATEQVATETADRILVRLARYKAKS